MCTSSVSNVIYHKFSHGAAFYTLNGKNVNIMLEFRFNIPENPRQKWAVRVAVGDSSAAGYQTRLDKAPVHISQTHYVWFSGRIWQEG